MIEPSAVTATLEARFAGLPHDALPGLADALMGTLDGNTAVGGPMVVVDTARGHLTVSFEFTGRGDPGIDVARGMAIIIEAASSIATGDAGQAVADATVVGLAMGWTPALTEAPQPAVA